MQTPIQGDFATLACAVHNLAAAGKAAAMPAGIRGCGCRAAAGRANGVGGGRVGENRAGQCRRRSRVLVEFHKFLRQSGGGRARRRFAARPGQVVVGKEALGSLPVRWGRAAAWRRFTGFSTLAFSLLGVVMSDGLLATGSARVFRLDVSAHGRGWYALFSPALGGGWWPTLRL